MVRLREVLTWGGFALSLVLVPNPVLSQTAGIGGTVTDSSGQVVPGVSVEASSPALIEGTRTVTTDGQGLYRIVDLRPGLYTVTFSLPGFTVVKREGVELAGAFTATVNAELKVSIEAETITVTAESPQVDVVNIVQQKVMTDELREDLPTARNVHNMAQIIPGTVMTSGTARPSAQDVGGLSGDRGVVMIHGSRAQDYMILIDGSMLNYGAAGSQAQSFNPAEGQEYIYQTAALSAESQGGGLRANVIPKEGGNRLAGMFLASYANGDFQSNNLDRELESAGLNSVNELLKAYDYNAAVGGPILQGKLWFFSSFRAWGQRETVAGLFRPIDPLSFVFNPQLGAAGNADVNRPAVYDIWNWHGSGRLTWQANQRNRLSLYLNTQPRRQLGQFMTGNRSFEASINQRVPRNRMTQVTWKSPLTSRVLLEAAFGNTDSPIIFDPTVPGLERVVSVTDQGTGFTFRSAPGALSYSPCYCYAQPNLNAAMSYVTGAHAAKFGLYVETGKNDVRGVYIADGVNYTLRNGVPISLTQYNQPRFQTEKYRSIGIFAQDQWKIRRLTVNAGLRFDSHVGWVPDTQKSGPGPSVPFQTWPAVDDVPNWKDVSPRLGVAYDLFGNGRTAVKASVSRYVVLGQTAFASQNNPINFNVSASRGWNDQFFGAGDPRSGNFVPDCDLSMFTANGECLALSNPAFGSAVTTSRPDDAIRTGWHVRPYNWEMSGSVQHQLWSRVSAEVGYYRRAYGNFAVVDNLALTPEDYSEYCATAPTDSRLPGGGGGRVCGLYDVNRFVTPNNLVTSASNYGDQTETYDGIDATLVARMPNITLSGGLSSGTSNNVDSINSRSNCFVIDSPQQLRFCDINMPWRTSVRFLGTVRLPWDIDLGATFLNNPGPEILANHTLTSAQVQFVNSSRSGLLAGSATIPLVKPGTLFADRMTQVDLRIGKDFRLHGVRVRALLDIANVTNSNAVLVHNTTYGSNWLRPTYVLPGRLIKPTIQFDF